MFLLIVVHTKCYCVKKKKTLDNTVIPFACWYCIVLQADLFIRFLNQQKNSYLSILSGFCIFTTVAETTLKVKCFDCKIAHKRECDGCIDQYSCCGRVELVLIFQ